MKHMTLKDFVRLGFGVKERGKKKSDFWCVSLTLPARELCPFCDCPANIFWSWDDFRVHNMISVQECPDCGATGPFYGREKP